MNTCLFKQDTCDYYNICGAIDETASLSSFTINPNPASDNAVLELVVKQGNNFSIVIQT